MIHHLNTKKANCPENIADKFYKLANEYMCSFLREIFNACALQGIFPHKLKLAKVIPIHKGGCVSSPNKLQTDFLVITFCNSIREPNSYKNVKVHSRKQDIIQRAIRIPQIAFH